MRLEPALGRAALTLAVLVAAFTNVGAEALPAGLTAAEWAQMQRAIGAPAPIFAFEAQLLGHPDPVGEDGAWAGYSVSISGDTAVIGAPHYGPAGQPGPGPGAAFVFVRSGTTWTEQQRLVPPDGGGAFGGSVAIDGDTVVVSAPLNATQPFVLTGAAFVFTRSGTSWTQQQKLVPSDGADGDRFGNSVSIDGDRVVVGAPAHTTPVGSAAGAAYVYVRTGTAWTEEQQLTAVDGAPNEYFGGHVSVSGDTVAVTAPLHATAAGPYAGAAYMFVRTAGLWMLQQELFASDAATNDYFGQSLSLWGDTVAVGASYADTTAGIDAGAVYVLVRSGSTWTEQQKLVASDGTAADHFGGAVSLQGDTVAVGRDGVASGADSVRVFLRSGNLWAEQQKLTAGGGSDAFGASVSVSGDTLVSGAYLADAPAGADAGAAHVFVRSGVIWSEQQTIEMPDSTRSDYFGHSVAIAGDTVAVGVPYDDTEAGLDAGSVYVFVRSGTTWIEQQKLTASDGLPNDYFGYSVAISGDTLVVGSWWRGRAYVFVRSGTSWTQQQLLTPSVPGGPFGWSVSISGDTILIGLGVDPSGIAAAYVFVRTGAIWTEQQILTPSDQTPFNLYVFGTAVSVAGDTAVVGDPTRDGPPPQWEAGAVYAFVRSGTTWTEQQILTASDALVGAHLGSSISLSADTIVAGAPFDSPGSLSAGSAYVFHRSGSTWTEEQKLAASDSLPNDYFGVSVSALGERAMVGATRNYAAYVFERSGGLWAERQRLTEPGGLGLDFGRSVAIADHAVAVGAPSDDELGEVSAGSVQVFHDAIADLSVTKTDGSPSAVPGRPVTYTITASNAGPTDIVQGTLADTVSPLVLGPTWTCVASPGSACTPSGPGSISDTVDLLVGGTATYTLVGTVDPAATGSLVNTASVAVPSGGADPNASNDSATDSDTLTPVADLAASKTDGQTSAVPGQALSYTIRATNAGPSVAAGATVTDAVPAALQGAAWTCVASAGSSCAAGGSGGISDTVTALVGGSLTYTLTGIVDPAATLVLANTASVSPPAGGSDPAMENNSATDVDALPVGFLVAGELSHGYDRRHDLEALPGPVAAQDVFRIYQQPHASYEILVDGISADLGTGDGPLLERLASDASTVLQSSSPAGAGGSRSLRWMNALDHAVAEEFVRVESAGCTTDCDAADVYRMRARETTGFVSRFNNSASQITVLVIENGSDQPVDMDLRFWSPSGALLDGASATLGARQSYVLNTTTIVPEAAGSITVANTARYGELVGKAVAVEPATGFTFDTALEPRRR